MPQIQTVVIHIELPTKGSFGVTGEAVTFCHSASRVDTCDEGAAAVPLEAVF
jgi:hypothetical protein